jgi:hypothetical protein
LIWLRFKKGSFILKIDDFEKIKRKYFRHATKVDLDNLP